jgi:hypothetical protein
VGKKPYPPRFACKSALFGGRGGIRTHGTLAGTPVFKTGALNHSATLPCEEFQSLTGSSSRTQCERGPNLEPKHAISPRSSKPRPQWPMRARRQPLSSFRFASLRKRTAGSRRCAGRRRALDAGVVGQGFASIRQARDAEGAPVRADGGPIPRFRAVDTVDDVDNATRAPANSCVNSCALLALQHAARPHWPRLADPRAGLFRGSQARRWPV